MRKGFGKFSSSEEANMKIKKIVVLLTIFLLGGCAVTSSYDAYYGKVVDIETKKPIEGAAVLVVYNTEQYGLAGAVSHFGDAQEVLTDKNGEFKIPAKRIITFKVLSGWERYPHFTIFKPAYGCYPNHKDVKPMFVPNGALPSDRFVIIELPKLKTKEERLENIGCRPVGVPEKAMKHFTKVLNIENLNLGLQPYEEVNK
jgi:hypothetical protein